MENDLEVKDSEISGQGVFAMRDFSKGEVVLAWDTRQTYTENEAMELPEELQHFLYPLPDGKMLLQQPPARFVNHSCEPNTHIVDDCSDVALRDIKAGEEITSDYSMGMPEGESFVCTCGFPNCKGVVKHP